MSKCGSKCIITPLSFFTMFSCFSCGRARLQQPSGRQACRTTHQPNRRAWILSQHSPPRSPNHTRPTQPSVSVHCHAGPRHVKAFFSATSRPAPETLQSRRHCHTSRQTLCKGFPVAQYVPWSVNHPSSSLSLRIFVSNGQLGCACLPHLL